MKRIHFYIGIAGLAVFLLTGLYMHFVHGHLVGYDEVLRMKYRSVHIYILMTGFLNLIIGLYYQPVEGKHNQVLQRIGSAAIIVSALLFWVSFGHDINLQGLERPFARLGIYVMSAGGVFSLLAAKLPPRS